MMHAIGRIPLIRGLAVVSFEPCRMLVMGGTAHRCTDPLAQYRSVSRGFSSRPYTLDNVNPSCAARSSS